MINVSIIIPVYNTEKYIVDCIDSVLKQSYQDFEVILIDDGSKDNSPIICDKYATRDQRFSVIHKENGGLSEARNVGLSLARGEFVLFLDSDDFWIGSDDLKQLMDYASSLNNDFCFIEFNRSRFFPSNKVYYPCPTFPKKLESGQCSSDVITTLIENGIFPMSACTKLLKRDFLLKNEIYFIKGLFSEDIPWFLDILRKASTEKIYYYNYYMYGNRAEVSTSLTSTFSIKKYNDVLDIIINQKDLISKDKWPSNVKDALYSFLAYRYCILLAQYHDNKKIIPTQLLNSTRDLKMLLNYDIHPKVKKANKIYQLFGLEITSFVLAYYMNKKDAIKKKHLN